MPWCDDCSRFWTPSSLPVDGTCPTCGRRVVTAGKAAQEARTPWHFKLLVAAVVLYLGWRMVQAAQWVVQQV